MRRRGTLLASSPPIAMLIPGRFPVTRTIGAAIGALIVVLFLAHIATRLESPVSASSRVPAAAAHR